MPVKSELKERSLTVKLSGELDHHHMPDIRAEIDAEIERLSPEVLILDFAEVTFMDSSGIGLIIGRYKLMAATGGSVMITNAPPAVNKVMRVSGLDKLVRIAKDKR